MTYKHRRERYSRAVVYHPTPIASTQTNTRSISTVVKQRLALRPHFLVHSSECQEQINAFHGWCLTSRTLRTRSSVPHPKRDIKGVCSRHERQILLRATSINDSPGTNTIMSENISTFCVLTFNTNSPC